MARKQVSQPEQGGVPGAAVVEESRSFDQGSRTSACPGRILSLQDAAAYLAVSYWTMRDLVASGEVPTVRVPNPRLNGGSSLRRILIDRSDLDAVIDRWKERGA